MKLDHGAIIQLSHHLLEFGLDLRHGEDGVFNFINHFSKILLITLSEEGIFENLPGEMWSFNLGLSTIIKFSKYGSNSYLWLESMIYNFTKVFRLIWSIKDSQHWRIDIKNDFIFPKPTKHKLELTINQSVIPRHNKSVTCGQCNKKISKAPKLFPLCFQGCEFDAYPKEIAILERPEKERHKVFTREQFKTYQRRIVEVCSAKCKLEAMAQMNPTLHDIMVSMPRILQSRVVDVRQATYGEKNK